MAGPGDSAPRLPHAFLLGRPKAALAISAVMHGALLYALSEVPWRAEPAPRLTAPPAVLWLRDWRPPADPASNEPAATDIPIVTPEPLEAAEPELRAEPALEIEVELGAEPASEIEPEPALRAAREPSERPGEAGADAPSQLVAEEPATPAAPGVDWEAERRRVIEELAERGELEAGHHRFGTLEELFAEGPAPLQEPGPERSIFEPGRGSGSSRGLLRPGHARTRFGRALTELCQALTGGVGVLGLFSVCAEERYRNDLFAHLQPEYLRRRPADFVVGRGRVDLDAAAGEPVAPLAAPLAGAP